MLNVLIIPNESLRVKSAVVTDFDENLHLFLDQMYETVKAQDGYGIAAPQVSKNVRVCVVEYDNVKYEIINPIIVEASGKSSMKEGCLSVPGYSEFVERAKRVKIQYQNRFGELQELVAENEFSHVVQHEIDHLDGILYLDRLSSLKKQIFRKWFSKKLKFAEQIRRQTIRRAKKEAKIQLKENKKNDTIMSSLTPTSEEIDISSNNK